MDVKDNIKVTMANYKQLAQLDCVKEIKVIDDKVRLILKPESTEGACVVNDGDYLVLFTNNKWQRFGCEAFTMLNFKPSRLQQFRC